MYVLDSCLAPFLLWSPIPIPCGLLLIIIIVKKKMVSSLESSNSGDKGRKLRFCQYPQHGPSRAFLDSTGFERRESPIGILSITTGEPWLLTAVVGARFGGVPIRELQEYQEQHGCKLELESIMVAGASRGRVMSSGIGSLRYSPSVTEKKKKPPQ